MNAGTLPGTSQTSLRAIPLIIDAAWDRKVSPKLQHILQNFHAFEDMRVTDGDERFLETFIVDGITAEQRWKRLHSMGNVRPPRTELQLS